MDDKTCHVLFVWPGRPMTAHGGVPDPAAAEGDHQARHRQFDDTAIILKRRIELMLALPLARLDEMSLRHELKNIGTS